MERGLAQTSTIQLTVPESSFATYMTEKGQDPVLDPTSQPPASAPVKNTINVADKDFVSGRQGLSKDLRVGCKPTRWDVVDLVPVAATCPTNVNLPIDRSSHVDPLTIKLLDVE